MAYQEVANRILDSEHRIDDERAVNQLNSNGLWRSENNESPGLPISIGILQSLAMSGVDRPCEGEEVCPNAWRAFCTSSPSAFLNRKSCRGHVSIPDMVESPKAYGSWESIGVVIRMPGREQG